MAILRSRRACLMVLALASAAPAAAQPSPRPGSVALGLGLGVGARLGLVYSLRVMVAPDVAVNCKAAVLAAPGTVSCGADLYLLSRRDWFLSVDVARTANSASTFFGGRTRYRPGRPTPQVLVVNLGVGHEWRIEDGSGEPFEKLRGYVAFGPTISLATRTRDDSGEPTRWERHVRPAFFYDVLAQLYVAGPLDAPF